MKSRNLLSPLAAALILLAAISAPAAAQKLDVRYDPISKTVNLDAVRADVRQIVRQLANAAGISRYRMDPSLTAPVTLTLRNAPFDRTLQTVLARAGAESDYAGGVLQGATAPARRFHPRC
jgi:hypothetical protein